MQLAVYLAKEVAAILQAVLTHEKKSCTMMERCICSARSCSTHRPDTMRPGKREESDPAVAWPVLQHTLGRPKSGSHQLLAPAFVTGLYLLRGYPAGMVSGPRGSIDGLKPKGLAGIHPLSVKSGFLQTTRIGQGMT